MPSNYLETSAFLKRYRTEPGSDVVRELFDGRDDAEAFLTTQLTVLEVLSVAARMLKGHVLRLNQYQRLIGTFLQDLDTFKVKVLPVDDRLIGQAMRLYPAHALRPADAIHFVSALDASRIVGTAGLYVVTGDHEITQACTAYGLRLLDPEAGGALRLLRTLR